ncbi:hypothetical protein [Listeria sp. PSOL-1]|uniref:hypothetical protein n=1 Tax=Listeria sp. PSOL-1 TaxID=1844999 RepID=UPI0013D75848|nr:hypothetical protein [Listeria sp. PSOL-1]
MKKSLLVLGFICSFLLFVNVSNVYASENLLVNGDFKDGLNGWENVNPTDVKIIKEGDTNFARVANGSEGYITHQTVKNLVPKATYILTADSRLSNNNTKAELGIRTDKVSSLSVIPSTSFISQTTKLEANFEGVLDVFFLIEPFPLTNTHADFTNFVLTKEA